MDTIDPDSITAELLERDDETEPVQAVPPVVAVMVTSDPGLWFEESLAALGAQDYSAMSVLVLDNGSTEDPTDRIAGALPGAFVRRCAPESAESAGAGGFAKAANEALESVEGAVFLLFCHDDVVFDPDAARLMVEEAYRSNAGIVGPKVVDREHPDILFEVGMSIDHYGVPFSGLEPGEVDQEQHDGVRDVFYVSHATMLVRADLFHELGGFDPATFPGADDIDLCWRARLAGARVIVAPAARIRRGRATVVAARRDRDRPAPELRDETRSRVRLLFKSYSALALVWVLPIAFLLNGLEALGLLVTGRPGQAGSIVTGSVAAFAHPGELRAARRATQRLRRIDDADVRDLMIRGSARLRRFMIERVHAGERLAEVSTRTRVRVDDAASRMRRLPAILAVALGVLVLFGSRSLLSGHVPEVGSFQAWPGVGAAWSTFTASWRTTMMGAPRPATPAFALMATFSAVLFDHPGLARSLLVGGALPVGAFGAYRLVRPFASSLLPGLAAAAAYAANPIARNAIWRGDLGALVCFAVAPFVLGAFVRAVAPGETTRTRVHIACTIALLVALAGSVCPPALLLAPLIALAYLLSMPFVGGARTAVLALASSLGASALALLLLAPWSFSLFGADAATLGAQPRASLSFASVLQFHTGRAGAGVAPFGILAAAVVPVAIATGPRLSWALRAWTLAAISFALAWLPGRLSAGATVLAPDAVLVGAAVALAFAAGLGVAAVLDDLRRFHFGWRQILMIVAFVGLGLSVVGFSADTLSGRFGLRADDWPSTYSWMGDSVAAGGFRVLWIGDPAVLPADAKVVGDVGFALTRNGPGDARVSWAAPGQHADGVLAGMIDAAAKGSTVRLGHLLAPAGVRYIAFVRRAAPTAGATGRDETPMSDALARQLDLTLSRVDGAGLVFNNDAWFPMRALVPSGNTTVLSGGSDPVAAAIRSEAKGVPGVAASSGTTPAVGPGTLLWSEAANTNWVADAAGRSAVRSNAFGWTNAFALDGHAPVRVAYKGNAVVSAARVLEVVIWFVVAGAWFATRRRRRVDPASEPSEADPVAVPVGV